MPALVLIDRAAAGVVGAVPTAYIESAQAIGLHLLDAAERDPTITSTYGVGQLIEVAIEAGAERIVMSSSQPSPRGRPCKPNQRCRPRWRRGHHCTNNQNGPVHGGQALIAVGPVEHRRVVKAMLMSRWAFSITLAASAVRIEAPRRDRRE